MEHMETFPSRYHSKKASSIGAPPGNPTLKLPKSRHEPGNINLVNQKSVKDSSRPAPSAKNISISVWIPNHLMKDNMFNRDSTDPVSEYTISLIEVPEVITAGQVLVTYISSLIQVKITSNIQLWESCDALIGYKENQLPVSITRPVGYEEIMGNIVSSWSTNYSRNYLKLKVKSHIDQSNKQSVLTFLSDLKNNNIFMKQQKITDLTVPSQNIYYWKDQANWKPSCISVNHNGLLTIWKRHQREIIRTIKSIHEFELYDITSTLNSSHASSFGPFSSVPSIGKYQFALKSHQNPDLFEDRQDLIHVFSLDNYNEFVNLAKSLCLNGYRDFYETSEKNSASKEAATSARIYLNQKFLSTSREYIKKDLDINDSDSSSDEDLPISLLEMKLTEKAKVESFNIMPQATKFMKPGSLLSKLDLRLVKEKKDPSIGVNTISTSISSKLSSYDISLTNTFRSDGLIGKAYGSLSSSTGNESNNHNIVDRKIKPHGLIGRRLLRENNSKKY